MRLGLLTCLSTFLWVNLASTQAVFAAPAKKAASKKDSGKLKVDSTRPNNDNSAAGYRLLKKVKNKNMAIYGRPSKNNSSQKLKK